MRRFTTSAVFVGALVLCAPAGASTLSNSGGTLTFAGAPAAANDVTFAGTGTVVVRFGTADGDPLLAAPGCLPVPLEPAYSCAGVTSVVVTASGGDDFIAASTLGVPIAIDGGEGDDSLTAGSGNDTVNGGPGDDFLQANLGADAISGGAGVDEVNFGLRASIAVSLDGQANDGGPGEGDNVLPDVEDVTAAAQATGTVTLAGSDAGNILVVNGGRGVLTGGPGSDALYGDALDDTIDARDGFADRVWCGAGNDIAYVDPLDTVSATCEGAPVSVVHGGADDHPPTVEWTVPTANAAFAGSTRTTLGVNASDDRGVARVRFTDGDRTVCEALAPPYTCAYDATAGDVGSNTLTATAIDGAGQATSVNRQVRITPFRARAVALARPQARPARPLPRPRARAAGLRRLRRLGHRDGQGGQADGHDAAGEADADLPLRRHAALPQPARAAPARERALRRRPGEPAALVAETCGASRLASGGMQIDGVNALVAGGASGLGAATARALNAAGANVTIADLNAERGAALAEELGASFVTTDVTDPTQVEAAVTAAAREDGLRIRSAARGSGRPRRSPGARARTASRRSRP